MTKDNHLGESAASPPDMDIENHRSPGSEPTQEPVDVVVVGAGAAGLATAIFTARRASGISIVALDGAGKLGAKILVSGGGRCNVTNTEVGPADFWGGSSHVVRRILRAFPAEETAAFFREIGVALHEEEDGKLFPDSNSARTVLDALLAEARRVGIRLLTDHRVRAVEPRESGFEVITAQGSIAAGSIVLATGGLSLPKTGSDGGGYAIAQALGHSIVPTTPGLAPLSLDGDFHAPLSGVSQDVELSIRVDRGRPLRLRAAMLWTHFGVSGPVMLDASRHWHRAGHSQQSIAIAVNFLPNDTFETAEKMLIATTEQQPRTHLRNALGTLLPHRFVEALLARLGIPGETLMAHLSREHRRKLLHGLLEWPLPVRGSRGYNFAEVTAGGIPLEEIDPSTMESRKCPGLYLVGEILDVDGRIGGFNFQWAWSSAFVAAAAIVQRATKDGANKPRGPLE